MISVIVPVYNVKMYLNRCVESIINQSYTDLQIILVDDGSTDSSGEICDEWERKDSRVSVIHKENGGLSDARNAGLLVASGEYVTFLDSDDWIEKDMYECMINAFNEDIDVVVTGIKRFYDNGYFINQYVQKEQFIYSSVEIVRKYLEQNAFSTSVCDKIFKRNFFDNRKFPRGRLYEDAPVLYDILKNCRGLAIIGKPQYYYFQRSTSICGQNFSEKKMDHYYFSYDIYSDVLNTFPSLQNVAESFWGCKLVELIYSIEESDNRKKFKKEKNKILLDLKKVAYKIFKSQTITKLIKFKCFLSLINASRLYIIVKKIKVKKG